MATVVALLLMGLVGWSASLAVLVAQVALTGSRYVQWSADPVIFWGELILAACSALLAVAATIFGIRRFRTDEARAADTLGWVGLGFLGVGGLGIAVGWLGLSVPTTPGYDVLSRSEPIFIIGGVVAAAFGALLSIIAFLAVSMRTRAEGPTWRVVRAQNLPGASPGDRVMVAVEQGSVSVTLVLADARGRRRLATYPPGVRLEPLEAGGYRLVSGSDELAILAPVDADPEVLMADLHAVAGRRPTTTGS